MLIQLAPNFLFDHALERRKQHAKLGGDVDFTGAHGNFPADTGAFEGQRLVLPLRLHLELFAHASGDPIDQGVCLVVRKLVRSADIDAGHGRTRAMG
jgi:hypothetical protein